MSSPAFLRRATSSAAVFCSLECLDLEDQGAAPLVERSERTENGLGIGTAVGERGTDEVGVVSKETRVKHGDWILY